MAGHRSSGFRFVLSYPLTASVLSATGLTATRPDHENTAHRVWSEVFARRLGSIGVVLHRHDVEHRDAVQVEQIFFGTRYETRDIVHIHVGVTRGMRTPHFIPGIRGEEFLTHD